MDTYFYLVLIFDFLDEHISAIGLFAFVFVFIFGFLLGHMRNNRVHRKLIGDNDFFVKENSNIGKEADRLRTENGRLKKECDRLRGVINTPKRYRA